MRHVPDGTLRRIVDEPLAVPDVHMRHLHRCERCRSRGDRIADDAAAAHRLLSRPQLVPDADRAWRRLAGQLTRVEAPRRIPRCRPPRRWRMLGVTVTGGAAVASAGALLVGAAAAATITTVFAPSRVEPVPVTGSELQAFAGVLGLGGVQLGGRPGDPSSTTPLGSFGTIRWSTPARPVRVSRLSAAESASGLRITLPRTLPAGVNGPPSFIVERAVTATVRFGSGAGPALRGSSLRVTFGPAVLAQYGAEGSSLTGLPTLAILDMWRPTATSSGATTDQLESFLLAQPGFPSSLARQIRLLGNLETALPVPTPQGAVATSLTIAGSPAVLLTEGGGAASGAVWEDGSGIVHTVAGLLDQKDVLGVARQLG